MPHKLSSTFTSYTYDDLGRRSPDHFGDFDLRQIGETGDIDQRCRRIGGNVTPGPLSGQAPEIDPNPFGYNVTIIQTQTGFRVLYRGIALFDDRGEQVTSIVGVRRIVRDTDRAEIAATVQDEATWVATKP
jgi:hypothetical protein